MQPPTAKMVPKTWEMHGQLRTDNYDWLRPGDPAEIHAYLRAENAYTEAVMAHTTTQWFRLGSQDLARPWRTLIAALRPSVDLLTELSEVDPGHGWRELGDIRIKEEYEYILSYSPYENVTARDYPDLLVTGGLHDCQVQYWHPAKWVAKLRAHNTGDGVILLRTNMEAGHAGASGRFEEIRNLAFRYAFILDLVGVQQ